MLTDPDRRFLSYGGGTQSSALALMSAAGELPRLDAVIFADTRGELPETYAFAAYVADQLAAVGTPFITASAGSLEAALLSPARTSANPTPPAKVLHPDGTRGRINAYRCSYDFKRRLVTREIKRLCGKPGAWKRLRVEQWIGYSADEHHRVKQDTECRCGHPLARHPSRRCEKCRCESFDRWRVNVHPLIEMDWRRAETIAWFAAHGHPTPPRSACWFCPNSTNARWRVLQYDHPELFERSCRLDEHIRRNAAFNDRGKVRFRGELYLHDQFVPLRVADLRSDAELLAEQGIVPMFSYDCLGDACDT